jgi:hypothetical protein
MLQNTDIKFYDFYVKHYWYNECLIKYKQK